MIAVANLGWWLWGAVTPFLPSHEILNNASECVNNKLVKNSCHFIFANTTAKIPVFNSVYFMYTPIKLAS